MIFNKKWLAGAVLLALLAGITGCSKDNSRANVLTVGTMAGPETQLMQVAKTVAKKDYNLEIKIVTFTDYNQPNEALNNGSIDANMFQHAPYLDAAIQAHHYNIVPIGKTYIYPMGIYSQQYKELSQILPNSIIAIPNDPSNQARALLLLQSAKLISLKEGGTATSTLLDVVANPKHFKIQPLDAAQLSRALPDVAAAVINTNYAVPAGLLPNKDAIFVESKDSPYANLIVVRTTDKDNANLLHLVDALHSTAVQQAATQLFQGQAVPAW